MPGTLLVNVNASTESDWQLSDCVQPGPLAAAVSICKSQLLFCTARYSFVLLQPHYDAVPPHRDVLCAVCSCCWLAMSAMPVRVQDTNNKTNDERKVSKNAFLRNSGRFKMTPTFDTTEWMNYWKPSNSLVIPSLAWQNLTDTQPSFCAYRPTLTPTVHRRSSTEMKRFLRNCIHQLVQTGAVFWGSEHRQFGEFLVESKHFSGIPLTYIRNILNIRKKRTDRDLNSCTSFWTALHTSIELQVSVSSEVLRQAPGSNRRLWII